jgi:hypothetical protein
MGSRLDDPFAIYPMTEVVEVTDRIAAAYALLLDRLPLVPRLYKSFALYPAYLGLAVEPRHLGLAVEPRHLGLAVEQGTPLLDGEKLARRGHELAASVQDVVRPPEQQDVRNVLAEFVGPFCRKTAPDFGTLVASAPRWSRDRFYRLRGCRRSCAAVADVRTALPVARNAGPAHAAW